ncbi:aspartate aminotransferase family protein [uncultured Roseibium sp.]|uniref:aspartate aminotransferase family protein n=1 Tax=uncultured Roseibium sp. TaxID=1936171 RepID=UPI002603850F|nr:aspartate aminotransferase family protein [uncultured Roseibium sp.]
MLRNDQLDQWDRENFFHPSTHLAQHARGEAAGRIVETASGVHIEDRDGNRLLDAFAGLYCVNVGYGRPEIAEAIAAQAKKLAYYHAYVGHGTEASITLSKMILDRAPGNMSKVYFGLGGSDANETNIKLVWYYNNILGRPAKKKIISRWRGYHGSGLMTGSLTGLELFHKKFDLPFENVLHTEAPYYFRRPDLAMSETEFVAYCASELEALIEREGADTIAAFIGEPAMGTGGLVPPPAGYWQAIQPILRKHDILLIADEVVTGFGRLGSMFGSEHYGIEADIITIAKGLTSAYAPLSGSIISEKVWDVLMKGTDESGPIGHGWTYSAHPIGAAAAIANLELVDSLGLVSNAGETGAYLKQTMAETIGDHQNVGEIRGEGLLIAAEFVEDRASRTYFNPSKKIGPALAAALTKHGVIARAMPQGDILGFAPPLCLTRKEADTIVEATKKAVVDVLG